MTKLNSSFEEKVKNHYLQDQGEDYHLKKRKLSDELVPWVARLRSEKFQQFVKSEDSVFEYGAGAGWNLINLKCKTKTAYDLSTLNKKKFQDNGIEFIEQEDLIPNEKYDVVICHHVLEHVPYPGITLGLLRDKIKSSGKLILVVPLEEQRNTKFNLKDREGHLYAWTPQTLGNLLDRSGFAVQEIKVSWQGYDRYAAELAKKLKLGEFGFRVLRRAAQTVITHREILVVAAKL